MKRYDTHRNFPPARRPRDSTPAPPEDDELERLLTAPQGTPSESSLPAAEPEHAGALPSPAPSSVASAVTAYVESLPASDPEPRLEESEIDVDAEAARAATSVVLLSPAAPGSDVAIAANGKTLAATEAAPLTPDVKSPSDVGPVSRVNESQDDDAGSEDEQPESMGPRSSPRSESAPVDSIAAIARSTAPAPLPTRGFSPALWIAGFTLGGIGLALWSLRTTPEIHGKSATEPATSVVISPASPEPVPAEPAAIPPPSPSGSVTPKPATSVR